MPYSNGPIVFSGVSAVVTALTSNSPELGTIIQQGQLHYQFVYNDGGETASAGYGLVLNSGASGYSCTVSSISSVDQLIGVVRNATFTTGCYGWVVIRGVTPVQMGATLSNVVRGMVGMAGNGTFAPVSCATGNVGNAVGAAMSAVASGASCSVFINVF